MPSVFWHCVMNEIRNRKDWSIVIVAGQIMLCLHMSNLFISRLPRVVPVTLRKYKSYYLTHKERKSIKKGHVMGNDRGSNKRENKEIPVTFSRFCRMRGLHCGLHEMKSQPLQYVYIDGHVFVQHCLILCWAELVHFRINRFEEYYSSAINLNNKMCH